MKYFINEAKIFSMIDTFTNVIEPLKVLSPNQPELRKTRMYGEYLVQNGLVVNQLYYYIKKNKIILIKIFLFNFVSETH